MIFISCEAPDGEPAAPQLVNSCRRRRLLAVSLSSSCVSSFVFVFLNQQSDLPNSRLIYIHSIVLICLLLRFAVLTLEAVRNDGRHQTAIPAPSFGFWSQKYFQSLVAAPCCLEVSDRANWASSEHWQDHRHRPPLTHVFSSVCLCWTFNRRIKYQISLTDKIKKGAAGRTSAGLGSSRLSRIGHLSLRLGSKADLGYV